MNESLIIASNVSLYVELDVFKLIILKILKYNCCKSTVLKHALSRYETGNRTHNDGRIRHAAKRHKLDLYRG